MATSALPAPASSRAWLDALVASRWTVPAIFALALALRVALIVLLPQSPQSDGAYYMARAAEMSQGLGYQEFGRPTAFWPVGYPALAALTMLLVGPGMAGPLLINLVTAAAILWLILWLARTLTGTEAAARLAALLYAVYPAHVAYTGQALSETVATAITMAAFALLVGGRYRVPLLLASGALFGLATLMRAQTIGFPFGAIVALLIVYRDMHWRAALKAGMVVYFALLAVVLPWSFRNQEALGSFVLVSTNGGVALQAGANDMADGGYFQIERSPMWAEVGIAWEDRIEREVELDRRLRTMAREWIAEDPLRWLALGPIKVAKLWATDTDGFWALKSDYPHLAVPLTLAQYGNQAFYMAVLLLGAIALLAGARAMFRRDDPLRPVALLICMPAFVSLTAFFFTGQTRYHYPAMPFLIVAAGWTLAHLTRLRIRSEATR